MAEGPTTKDTVDSSIPTEFIAEVRLKDQEGQTMRPLVHNVNLPEHKGGTWEMTELSRVTAVALGEALEGPSTELTDTNLEITPTEYGATVELSDLTSDQFTSSADLPRLVGRILGNAMITKEDIDLLTQIDSFSVQIGGAGTSLVLGHIIAAGAAIRSGGQAAGAITAGTQEPAMGKISGVFNDNQLHTVVKNLAVGRQIITTSGASQEGPQPGEAANAALREAFVGRIGRVDVYADQNLSKDASDDAKGGVFEETAIVQVHFRGGPRFEPDRKPRARLTEYNVVQVKGVGEWKDARGREVLCDAASPSS